jgi:hypothetical protein
MFLLLGIHLVAHLVGDLLGLELGLLVRLQGTLLLDLSLHFEEILLGLKLHLRLSELVLDFGSLSLQLSVLLEVLLSDSVARLTDDLIGVKSILLTMLSLHVLEESAASDVDIRDFDSLEPHTPTSHHILHALLDAAAKLVTVAENGIDGRVGDTVTHNRDSHLLKFLIDDVRAASLKFLAESLVELERILAMGRPIKSTRDSDTHHLLSDLLGLEVNLPDDSRELDDLVTGPGDGVDTGANLDALTVSDDDHVLVSL